MAPPGDPAGSGQARVLDDAARRLQEHRQVYATKPVLRELYREWYSRLCGFMVPGPTAEIGSGPGTLEELVPGAIATDVVWCPWLDAVVDGTQLAFRGSSLSNLVLFDVLHHLPCPVDFFDEARRVLVPGGRLLMSDPFISPFSRLVFALFHPEPVDLECDPLAARSRDRAGGPVDPFAANQAVATTLFWRRLPETLGRLPGFRLVHRSRDALLRYPLSGGFEHRSLAPGALFPALALMERLLSPLAPLMAFRTLVVLERAGGPA